MNRLFDSLFLRFLLRFDHTYVLLFLCGIRFPVTDDLQRNWKGMTVNGGAFTVLDKSSSTAFFRAQLKHYLPPLLCSLGYSMEVMARVQVSSG